MNNLVIAAPLQVLPSAEINLGGTSSSESVFITSATKGSSNPIASQAIQLWIPTNAQLAGTNPASGSISQGTAVFNAAFTSGHLGAQRTCVRFRTLAFGRVVTGTTSTFQVKQYFISNASRTAVTSAVPASGNQVAASGAPSLASITGHWEVECWFIYDAVSQRLDGNYQAQMHTTQANSGQLTVLTNSQTGLDMNNPLNTYAFVLTGQFGTGNAGNQAFVDGFYLFID